MPDPELTSPFLSVVIPTYNRRESLRRTLDGLARQDYPAGDFEAVVVSDGSTDGTDEMMADYVRTAPYRLRYVTQSNGGPSRARNRGVQEAGGEVIVFLDDDVEPAPTFLSAHAAHHRADERVAVIGPMLPDPARRKSEPIWIAWEHASLEKQYTNFRTGVWPGAGPNHFYSGNASVRRTFIVAAGGFNETFNRQEDVELAFRLTRTCGVHFAFDAHAVGAHRPARTFASWLLIPYAYGQLDVVRAQTGAGSWEVIRGAYYRRSASTRFLADLLLAAPWLSGTIRTLLLVGALLAAGLHATGVALSALSVIYNLRYLEGARVKLGSRLALSNLIRGMLSPTA